MPPFERSKSVGEVEPLSDEELAGLWSLHVQGLHEDQCTSVPAGTVQRLICALRAERTQREAAEKVCQWLTMASWTRGAPSARGPVSQASSVWHTIVCPEPPNQK